MAQQYHSHLDYMRKRAIAEGFNLQTFWDLWHKIISHEISIFSEDSATVQQYNAEKNLFRKFWPGETFAGLDLGSFSKGTNISAIVASASLANVASPSGPNAADSSKLAGNGNPALSIPTGPRSMHATPRITENKTLSTLNPTGLKKSKKTNVAHSPNPTRTLLTPPETSYSNTTNPTEFKPLNQSSSIFKAVDSPSSQTSNAPISAAETRSPATPIPGLGRITTASSVNPNAALLVQPALETHAERLAKMKQKVIESQKKRRIIQPAGSPTARRRSDSSHLSAESSLREHQMEDINMLIASRGREETTQARKKKRPFEVDSDSEEEGEIKED